MWGPSQTRSTGGSPGLLGQKYLSVPTILHDSVYNRLILFWNITRTINIKNNSDFTFNKLFIDCLIRVFVDLRSTQLTIGRLYDRRYDLNIIIHYTIRD